MGGKKAMRKMTGARECSGIERSGVDTREEEAACLQRGKAQQGKRKRRSLERQRRSKAAQGQKNQNVQQKRGVVERRSEEPSKC